MDLAKLTKLSIFTALVFVATTLIRIPIPATGGYFNFGDGIIFAAALLYGPLVGGFAGGVGAAIADAIGFPIFAPGTLLIKLCEGAVAGYVGTRIRPKMHAVALWRALSVILGLGLGAATYYIGINYLAAFGNALLDQAAWAIVALFLGGFIVYAGFKPQTETSWQTTAMVLGGVVMVAGYFLYENLLALLLPGLGIFAVAEIPANIGQMLVGLTIALPMLRVVKKALPPKQNPKSRTQK
ncbi:MAG: ECF transporter S component [Candidatus Bathyarchaeota archaeon]|nr:ECF transporter S component [Candidatus Bathyarchaeota archaeon]